MAGRIVLGLCLLGLGGLALAEEAPAAESPAEEPAPTFRVDQHLFGARVEADARGRCQAPKGQEIKVWYVAGFPASLGRFESCAVITSPQARGDVLVGLRIVGPSGMLQEVEGALDLGTAGRGVQTVAWEGLELPQAGAYFLEVEVDGQQVARLPMRVEVRRARAK
jgi:hypothetical protein